MDHKTVLLLHKVCPFAERAWITLEEKKVPYQLKQVSLTNKQKFFTQTYRKAYGHDPASDGKVPVLVDGERVLTESDLVSWYLAEKYNTGTQLIPEDPFERLRIRHFVSAHGKLIGAFYSFVGYKKKSKQDQEKLLQSANKILQQFQKSLQLPYALGDKFTLADVLLYPWFARWVALQKLLGVGLDQKYVKIHQWVKNIQSRESVKNTKQPDEFYVEGYRTYFD